MKNKQNVYDASIERIREQLLKYSRYYVALSGGKDSTVLLHLIATEARKMNKKIGVLIVDTEAQYETTNAILEDITDEYSDIIELYWVCLPLKLDNTLSCFSNDWICWDKTKKEQWIRPQSEKAITDCNFFSFYHYGMGFYEFIKHFAEWYSKGQKSCAFVGLRADESKTRMNIFVKNNRYIYKNIKDSDNIYPIFDWKVSDIWHYSYVYGKSYNEIYSIMNMAGVPLKQQRVGQLFGNEQKRALHITRVIEHKTWVKMLYRVNGVDFTARISKDGFVNKITKPINKSWEEFALFICDTLPIGSKNLVSNRVQEILKLWSERGYEDNIPDEAPYCLEKERKVPSWRRICKTLLQNDLAMGGYGLKSREVKMYKRYINDLNNNIQKSLF